MDGTVPRSYVSKTIRFDMKTSPIPRPVAEGFPLVCS